MDGGAQAVGASERVFELLDRTPQLTEPGTMEPMGSPEGGDINLQDVTCAATLHILSAWRPNVWMRMHDRVRGECFWQSEYSALGAAQGRPRLARNARRKELWRLSVQCHRRSKVWFMGSRIPPEDLK